MLFWTIQGRRKPSGGEELDYAALWNRSLMAEHFGALEHPTMLFCMDLHGSIRNGTELLGLVANHTEPHGIIKINIRLTFW